MASPGNGDTVSTVGYGSSSTRRELLTLTTATPLMRAAPVILPAVFAKERSVSDCVVSSHETRLPFTAINQGPLNESAFEVPPEGSDAEANMRGSNGSVTS